MVPELNVPRNRSSFNQPGDQTCGQECQNWDPHFQVLRPDDIYFKMIHPTKRLPKFYMCATPETTIPNMENGVDYTSANVSMLSGALGLRLMH